MIRHNLKIVNGECKPSSIPYHDYKQADFRFFYLVNPIFLMVKAWCWLSRVANRKRGAQIRIDYYARSRRTYTCAQARTCACIIAGLHLLQFVYRPRGWFSYRQRPRPPAPPPPIHNRSLMHGHVIIFPISSDRAARRFCMRPVRLL